MLNAALFSRAGILNRVLGVPLDRNIRRSLQGGSGTSALPRQVLGICHCKNFRMTREQGTDKDLLEDSKAKVYTPLR